jgi:hypothetical protein
VHGDGAGACAYRRLSAPQPCTCACVLYVPVFACLCDHMHALCVWQYAAMVLSRLSARWTVPMFSSPPAKICGAPCCARCAATRRTLFQSAGGLAAANKQLALLDAFVPFWLKLDLRMVVLSYNRISELPDSFSGLASLEELRLSNNFLATFPAPVHARKHTRINRCPRALTEHTCIGAASQPAPHP